MKEQVMTVDYQTEKQILNIKYINFGLNEELNADLKYFMLKLKIDFAQGLSDKN